MVVLVTGATGFIGSNLVKLLVNKNYKVNIIVRNQAAATKIINENQINYHLYDGSLLSLEKIVSTCKPDIIYHLASEFIKSHSLQDIKKLIDANILFGTQLIELSSREKTSYFVNISTNWKYYNQNSYNPVNLYAATKKAFEDNNVTIRTLKDRVAHIKKVAFDGKRLVVFSGGDAKDDQALMDEVLAIHQGDGNGSIIGRNCFQRSRADALALLEQMIQIYKSK